MAAPLRVGYVPEHFCSPLLQLAELDKDVELVALPSGTGQHIASLDAGEIDVSIALTESLLAGIAKGKKSYKLAGLYVTSPLRWAIITGAKSRYNSVEDLRGGKIGISRVGSGSQVMASVLALREKWFSEAATETVEDLRFVVNDNFKGLRDAINSDETAFFMWEWFTTKDFVDSGECRFIGHIDTPWPSWAIAASPSADATQLSTFLERLSCSVRAFDSIESRSKHDVDFIKSRFGYREEDIHAWLKTVKYPTDCDKLPRSVVFDTLKLLGKAGAVQEPASGWSIEQFVRTDVAKLE